MLKIEAWAEFLNDERGWFWRPISPTESEPWHGPYFSEVGAERDARDAQERS
jgi:hypothetical protein